MVKVLIILFSLLCVVACKRDHLYYATSDDVVVRLNIDWSVSKFTPNGVTVYIYDSKGDRYGSSILSSDTEQVNLRLPADTYTIVVHNDSRSEFSNVEFINSDKLSTFMVRSLEFDHPYYEPNTDEFIALEPDDILAATVRDVVTTGSNARYHYDKPDLTEYTSAEVIEVFITPAYIVHLAEVQAYIINAHMAVDVPIAMLHGMSRGYFFGIEKNSSERVLEEFPIEISDIEDNVFMEFSTFGFPYDEELEQVSSKVNEDHDAEDYHDISLDMLFMMADGTARQNTISLDETEIEIYYYDDDKVRVKYLIVIDDEYENDIATWDIVDDFEYNDDDAEDLEEGTYDPSIDNWVDVVVPLPI